MSYKVHDRWFSDDPPPDATLWRWVGAVLHHYATLFCMAWAGLLLDLWVVLGAVAVHATRIVINLLFILASPLTAWVHAYYWRKEARADAAFSRWVEANKKPGKPGTPQS